MSMVKEAADRLLRRGELTQNEYNLLESRGLLKEGAINWKKIHTQSKLVARNIRNFSKDIVLPLGAITAGGIALKELLIDPARERSAINKSFQAMPSKVPQLMDKNPQEIRDYFDVVKMFSPKAASNPLVAGALVNKMMEFGGVDHKLVQDISSLENGGLSKLPMVDRVIESSVGSMLGAKKKA